MTNRGDVALRDFIYMDVDRLKSLLAQLEQGLLASRSDAGGTSTTAEGGGSVKIPALTEIGAKAQYLWTNQSTETRTLHDNIYNQIEERLLESNRLVCLPDDFSEGKRSLDEFRSSLSSVTYVRAKGKVVINDYQLVCSLIEDYNQLVRDIALVSHMNDLRGAVGKQRKTVHDIIDGEVRRSQLDKETLTSLGRIMRRFYHDRLVIRLNAMGDHVSTIVGPLYRSMLRDSTETLVFKYGSRPATDWTIFGQITAVPKESESEGPPPTITMTNKIEQGMEELIEAARDLEKFFGVTYPDIAITPIAVFRD